MIEAQSFNGVQSVNSVGERDKLDTNQSVVCTAVVNIPFGFQAATDEGREYRTRAELNNVSIVQEKKENQVLCLYIEMTCKNLLELNKGK